MGPSPLVGGGGVKKWQNMTMGEEKPAGRKMERMTIGSCPLCQW